MLNLLLDGGGDSFSRRRVFMVPSVEALSLKVAGCCPGNSANSFNMFTKTAMTCRMKIIANCHNRAII